MICVNGDVMTVNFDNFGIDNYAIFLKAKKLPESNTEFVPETEGYRITAPARFASLLGVVPDASDKQALEIASHLYDDQAAITQMALDAKRFAIWSDCGLGKTAVFLEWARHVMHRTGGRVLIVTQNEIVKQTIEEAQKFYSDRLLVVRLKSRDEMKEWCAGQVKLCRCGADVTNTFDDEFDGEKHVLRCRSCGADIGDVEQMNVPKLAITNYEKWNPESLELQVVTEARMLAGIILDECFAKGTLIDAANENGMVVPTPIERLEVGGRIQNASGIDTISDIHRREVQYAIRITIDGQRVISSPNHPWLTQRGWVAAQDLIPGDYCVSTIEAMRLLREFLHDPVSELGCEDDLRLCLRGQVAYDQAGRLRKLGGKSPKTAALAELRLLRTPVPSALEEPTETLLRSLLFSELADESTGIHRESSQPRGSRQNIEQSERLVATGQPSRREATGKNHHSRIADGEPINSSETLPHIESHEPQTFRAWWQWDGIDRAGAGTDGCTWSRVGAVCCVAGPTNSRVSNALQDQLRQSRAANRHRGGWSYPSQPKAAGREEGCQTGLIRVDGVEVLELGHPDLESLRNADGKLYFYDLGGTRHPSYSVAGVLVHNSNRLACGGGKQKWALIKSCRGIEYKLSCTATPAPNEVMEFASQASFLEKMRDEGEILWTFFRRDEKTHRWTVKTHAREAFFRFMANWSIYMRDPRRYGWRLDMPDVPEPEYFVYEIDMTEQQMEVMRTMPLDEGGQCDLYESKHTNAIQRMKLSQVAKGFRYRKAQNGAYDTIDSRKPDLVADLIRQEKDLGLQVLVWTEFDAESNILMGKLLQEDGVELLVGKTKEAARLRILESFRSGETRVLLSRPAMLGFGMNFQFVGSMIFSGWSDSFVRFYQALRRAYRQGQMRRLRVHLPVVRELEGDMLDNLYRKQASHLSGIEEMERHYAEARKELSIA